MEKSTITFYPSKLKLILAVMIIASFTFFAALVMVAFFSHDSPFPLSL